MEAGDTARRSSAASTGSDVRFNVSGALGIALSEGNPSRAESNVISDEGSASALGGVGFVAGGQERPAGFLESIGFNAMASWPHVVAPFYEELTKSGRLSAQTKRAARAR